VDRLVRHGEVATFRELCERVLTPNTRYLVLDLDRTTHLGSFSSIGTIPGARRGISPGA
jgi:hypothetical protein